MRRDDVRSGAAGPWHVPVVRTRRDGTDASDRSARQHVDDAFEAVAHVLQPGPGGRWGAAA